MKEIKVAIDTEGYLWLRRRGKLTAVFCPYSVEDAVCGDWCALFNVSGQSYDTLHIELCKSTITWYTGELKLDYNAEGEENE